MSISNSIKQKLGYLIILIIKIVFI